MLFLRMHSTIIGITYDFACVCCHRTFAFAHIADARCLNTHCGAC